MILTDRDYLILRELSRWKFLLGRHIKVFGNFTGERACDRRIKILFEAGYIKREKILYGVPSLYTLTYKGKILIGANKRQDKIKIEQITHDIMVLDSAVYFINQYNLKLNDILTEKELHSADGFNIRKHCPDFIFTKDDKTFCVEIELTAKTKDRFLANLKNNYMKYDCQIWILPKREVRNRLLLEKSGYTDIEIIEWEGIDNYIKNK